MKNNILKEFVKRTLLEQAGQDQVDSAMDMLKDLVKQSPFAGKAYVAGGFVRDTILGRPSKDIDIVVEMDNGGIAMANWLAKKLGIRDPVIFENFGTAMLPLDGVVWNGVDLGGLDLEFVQTRTETYTPEGGRKPQVGFGTIEDDVNRRDFTVNALLYDLTNDKIIDLVGGVEDIKKGIIRTPQDPEIIFNEDPLRMLRAVRFAGRYGWDIDPAIVDSIRKNSKLINTISRERVRDEFIKIIKGSMPDNGIQFLHDTGLLNDAIPELSGLSLDTMQKAARLSNGSEIDFTSLLSLMSGLDVKRFSRSLKLSNEELQKIQALLGAFAILADKKIDNDVAVRKAGAIASKKDVLENLSKYLSMFGRKVASSFGQQPTIFFNGNELMQMLDVKPGPILRDLTDFQKELWFENPDISHEEVRELIMQEFGSE
jgi:tRNA nucleotidyltransferase/poly(A) polymerase